MNKIGLVIAAVLSVAGCRSNFGYPVEVHVGDEVYDCQCVVPGSGEAIEAYVCANPGNVQGACNGACLNHGAAVAAIVDEGETCPSKGPDGYELSGDEAGSKKAKWNPATSLATITIDGRQQQVRAGGDVSFTAGCEGASCSISLNQISLIPENFSALQADVTRIHILNIGAMSATMTRGHFTIPSEQVQLLVNASVNGVPKALTFSPYSGQDLHGYYVPSTGSFGLSAQFHSETGSLQLDLQGVVAR